MVLLIAVVVLMFLIGFIIIVNLTVRKMIKAYAQRKERIKHKKNWERSTVVLDSDEERDYSEYINPII